MNCMNNDAKPHFAMNAGDGPLSYLQNSSYQRGVLDDARLILEEEIMKNLEISSHQTSFCIADFGCSTGKNSFQAMQIIIDAVKLKRQSSSDQIEIPEFYVFFNDVVTNDFNTLFTSLPPERNYGVAAVPGNFHRRLLPPSSVHFAYCCWSLHWLTEAPKAVADRSSPAWNGGEIFYTRERKEVCDAYLDQFGKDMESFLNSRAVEMVDGGLTAVIIPGVPADWEPEKEFTVASVGEDFRSILMEMAKKGRLSEAKIDSFNIPHYYPTLEQLKEILERSQSFSIEKMEIIKNKGDITVPSIKSVIVTIRAAYESMVAHHFGGEIIDELFDQYEKKIVAAPIPKKDKTIMILAVLKRRSMKCG